MVELDFALPDREAEWQAWYTAHLAKLLAMPGFHSAQRFRSIMPAVSPYLAIYGIDSMEVFESDAYRARGGPKSPGEWTPFMTNWHRNVFAGTPHAPDVGMDEVLVVVDRLNAADPAFPPGLTPLRCVGLNQSVYERGIAVCSPERARGFAANAPAAHTRTLRPMARKVRA